MNLQFNNLGFMGIINAHKPFLMQKRCHIMNKKTAHAVTELLSVKWVVY